MHSKGGGNKRQTRKNALLLPRIFRGHSTQRAKGTRIQGAPLGRPKKWEHITLYLGQAAREILSSPKPVRISQHVISQRLPRSQIREGHVLRRDCLLIPQVREKAFAILPGHESTKGS